MSVEPPRLDMKQFPPEAYRHLLQLEGLVSKQFDPILYHLIKLRASQINGCAYCLQMHTDEALRHGETPERMTSLDGWHESPLYSDKERAVLAWVDEVTLIADKHASKDARAGLGYALPALLSRCFEQRGFVLDPCPLLDLGGVAAALRVAATMSEAEVVELLAPARHLRHDRLDPGA